MKQVLLLVTLLFIVPQAHSQHRRVPILNSEKAGLPPDDEVAPSRPASYTEITFTKYYGRYDTSTLRIVKYSKDGKLLQTDEYEYNHDKDYDQPPFDRIQSHIGEDTRTLYSYDEGGRLKSKREFAVFPANSLNAILMTMRDEALAESIRKEREGRVREDEVKRAEQGRKRLTGLIDNGIPESAFLKEEVRYDADGNEIYTSQAQNDYDSRYVYAYDQRGRVTMQRELYNRGADGKVGGVGILDTHFTYTNDDKLDSALTYYAGNDTNHIPTDLLPNEYVHYRYHDMGKPYVISYEKDGMQYLHILSYADTMVGRCTVLSERLTDMVPKYDTGSITTYRYDERGNRTESASIYFYDGKRSSIIATKANYNKDGLPVEVRKYRSDYGKTEEMSEQSLFLYNTPDDKETLARSMSYRRPRKYRKAVVATQRTGRAGASSTGRLVQANGVEEPQPPVVYKGPVAAPQQQEVIFAYVEQTATYKGDVNDFISKNLRYPEAAKKAGVEGKVMVKFVVMATGEVTKAAVVKSLGSGCDEEALRLVSIMPPWTPGMNNGIRVNSYYTLPITFSLNK